MPRKLKPCGTQGGYSRHRYRGEEPCDACRRAWNEYCRNWRHNHDQPETPHVLEPCGTYAAAQRHKKNGEPVCDDCVAAERDYKAEWARNFRAAERERRQDFATMFAEVVAEITGAVNA